MFCMKCGAQNEDGAKFCTTCGASLEGIAWSTPQDASAPAPAPEAAPAPEPVEVPAPEPVVAPAPEPATKEAPQVPESWGEPVDGMPPQEWPDASEPSPIQESGQPKKGLGTGAIVGIIVGGIVVVALIVVAALFMTGTLSLGGTPDEPAKEEPAGDDGDVSIGGEIGNLVEDPGSGDEPAADPADVSGTVFDRTSYDGAPTEIADALEAAGLSLDGTSAYHYDDGSDSLYLDYTGTVDGALPVEGADDEVSVALSFGAEEFDFPWDEDDSAYDFDVNLAELPADTELRAANISFDVDLEPEEFVSTIVALRDSLGLSGDVGMLSATSSELADQAADALGISDEASISIHGDASYECVTVYFEDGMLDITRWSSGDTSISIGYSN